MNKKLLYLFLITTAIIIIAFIACDDEARPPLPPSSNSTATTPQGPVLFRFTVTSDSRYYLAGFEQVLDRIVDKFGNEGAFHILTGDFDPAASNHAVLKAVFGDDLLWYPVLGNHDLSAKNLAYFHSYFDNALSGQVNPGPPGSEKTTYSWDYLNAHFVVLNQYYDGTSETTLDGDISDALYSWLVTDLGNTTQPLIFVIGHEPAFPVGRHVGDSLDKYEANRNRFWNLLEEKKVMAHFVAHSHRPSIFHTPGGSVLEIDSGQARGENKDYDCFLNIVVREDSVEFQFFRNRREDGNYVLFPRVVKSYPAK